MKNQGMKGAFGAIIKFRLTFNVYCLTTMRQDICLNS